MFFIYKILINLVFFFSPIIIIFRIFKGKEDTSRFKEKVGIFSKKRNKGKLIWFHGASVGEIQSIIPLLERFEKNKEIRQILVTSNTVSSSFIIKNLKFKKIIHQFFPIDCNFISKKFLNYWKPTKAFFIDSEIWPNTVNNLYKRNIPIFLLNGRITKKSFRRWKFFSYFAKSIFGKFYLCLSSNTETKKYLKKLGAKNIKFIGNLKFSQSENEKTNLNKDLINLINSRKAWCASSTHYNEEELCGMTHIRLKKRFKNILTIIIPRHINRIDSIKAELQNLDLKIHLDEPKKKISPDTDIYLVNSYGKTKLFYKVCKNIFLGGSLIEHGGQNPLEATRYGCKVLHGPNVSNFREIYKFLNKKKLSKKISNQDQLINCVIKYINSKNNSKKIIKDLHLIGMNILNKTYKEINK
jgi:3-deoxy-D-manno-octulosonic-acid transferase